MGQILYAGAIHRVEQAKIDAARLTQAANNERSAAESELARFSSMLGNRRRMDAAGKQIAHINEAIAKNVDAKAAGDLNGQIQLAEELGRSATMASAAGVGGSSVEAYNHTVQLRQAIGQERTDRAFRSDLFAAGEDKATTLDNAVAGLDNNSYRANLDHRVYVDHKKMGLFQRIATLGVAAAATYFGGPQAGMAVIGASEAENAAENGDFAGASQGFTQALGNAVGGFRAARTTGFDGFWNNKPAAVPQLPANDISLTENPTYGGGSNFLRSGGWLGYGGYGSVNVH